MCSDVSFSDCAKTWILMSLPDLPFTQHNDHNCTSIQLTRQTRLARPSTTGRKQGSRCSIPSYIGLDDQAQKKAQQGHGHAVWRTRHSSHVGICLQKIKQSIQFRSTVLMLFHRPVIRSILILQVQAGGSVGLQGTENRSGVEQVKHAPEVAPIFFILAVSFTSTIGRHIEGCVSCCRR